MMIPRGTSEEDRITFGPNNRIVWAMMTRTHVAMLLFYSGQGLKRTDETEIIFCNMINSLEALACNSVRGHQIIEYNTARAVACNEEMQLHKLKLNKFLITFSVSQDKNFHTQKSKMFLKFMTVQPAGKIKTHS